MRPTAAVSTTSVVGDRYHYDKDGKYRGHSSDKPPRDDSWMGWAILGVFAVIADPRLLVLLGGILLLSYTFRTRT
jgi:hypothetical protein